MSIVNTLSLESNRQIKIKFHNRPDEDSLNQFLSISRIIRKEIYSIQMPESVIPDLDSTLLDAYGRQEGRAFNFHY